MGSYYDLYMSASTSMPIWMLCTVSIAILRVESYSNYAIVLVISYISMGFLAKQILGMDFLSVRKDFRNVAIHGLKIISSAFVNMVF